MAEIKSFGGLDNQNAETDYGLSRLAVAQNIDITRANKIKLRQGRQRLATAVISSAWAGKSGLLYQSADKLYQITQVAAGAQISDGLAVTNWLTAAEANNKIFWTNGTNDGVIVDGQNRALGLTTPEVPLYSTTSGMMPAGRYMFTVTLVRDDGFESGAPLAALVDLTEGGIRVGVALPEGAVKARLYLTNCNGSELYLAGERVGSGVIEYRGDTLDLMQALRHQFCNRPPRFDHAAYYRGAMYYAAGNVLYSSLPHHYELVDFREDYITFTDAIEMVAAVDTGLYVATTRNTYFLRGTTISDFASVDIFNYGAIRGTLALGLASNLIPSQAGEVVMWGTERGIVVGSDSGVKNLTNDVFHLPQAPVGCGAIIEDDGQQKFICSLRGG